MISSAILLLVHADLPFTMELSLLVEHVGSTVHGNIRGSLVQCPYSQLAILLRQAISERSFAFCYKLIAGLTVGPSFIASYFLILQDFDSF